MLKDSTKAANGSSVKSGDLFASIDEDFDPYEKYKNLPDLTMSELLSLEKKSLGYYLSGHPLMQLEAKLKNSDQEKLETLQMT